MEVRKGFVYTLEAVIASALILGVVITVAPSFEPGDNSEVIKESMYSTLRALDKTGELGDNLSSEAIEDDLNPYVPVNYNYSVSVTNTTAETYGLNELPTSINRTGKNFTKLYIWVEDGNSLDIIFDGKTVVSDFNGKGYIEKEIASDDGQLSYTGSGTAHITVTSYSTDLESVTAEQLISVGYIVFDGAPKEVNLRLWPL